MVTRSKTKGSALTALRKGAREYLTKLISKTNYNSLSMDILDRKLQRNVQTALKKIYPLSACNIRWFIMLGKETSDVKAPKKETKPEEKPKAEASA
jgi:ribosomal protein S3AE